MILITGKVGKVGARIFLLWKKGVCLGLVVEGEGERLGLVL
jgi:hypothetical protein